MASYGRNFDFRIPPDGANRKGRFILTDAGGAPITTPLGTAVPLGAPVTYDSAGGQSTAFPGADSVKLATGAQAPTIGLSGVLVYEHAPAAFAGYDPNVTLYADLGYAPVGKLVQVVSDPDIKVLLKNTAATTFLQTTSYAARKMVAGIGQATPTIAVGDLLTPGTGTDSAGYWAETGTASQGWLRVVSIDNSRAEVEAQLLF